LFALYPAASYGNALAAEFNAKQDFKIINKNVALVIKKLNNPE
jgi:hypothetical protein